jgi:hypothetical protein
MRDLINFIPLEAVLARVFPLISNSSLKESHLLEWASQGMEEIQTYKAYERAFCIQEVTNHRALIPKGLYGLEMMMYRLLEDETGGIDSEDLPDVIVQPLDDPTPNSEPINSLFFNYNNNLWQPLPISDSIFDLAFLCDESPLLDSFTKSKALCNNTFSIDIKSRTFLTTFDAGFIALAYLRAPMNEEGQFLIPNNEHFKQALETYMLKKVWEFRMNTKEQGAMQMYQMYSQQWELL